MLKKLTISLLIGLLLSGCGSFVKAARTANDIAEDACAVYFAERQGISLDDAAKAFCATREVLDVFAAAQKEAGDSTAETLGLPAK